MSDLSLDDFIAKIKFNKEGLVPVIAQQYDSKEVLMMAWMNQEAIKLTLTHKEVWYYSRSRQKLWRKGESSGQIQKLVEMRFDCDGDTLLIFIDQQGVACHTGRRSCFFNAWRDGKAIETSKPLIDPNQLYHH